MTMMTPYDSDDEPLIPRDYESDDEPLMTKEQMRKLKVEGFKVEPTPMMSTTMGYTCGCGSVLRYKTKATIKAHAKSKKHKKFMCGENDYSFINHRWYDVTGRSHNEDIHIVDLKVEYATTYGRVTIENKIYLQEATWEQLEEEINRRVKLAKTKYEDK